jgi:hypothetical protein
MVQSFLRVFGVVFLLLGVAGFFIPSTGSIHDLLNLSAPHNLIHLLSGMIFLAVSSNFRWSKVVAIVFGALYTLVAILGLFVDDIFGLSATPSIEVLHFLFGLLALFVGLKDTQSATKNQSESAYTFTPLDLKPSLF